MTYMHQGNCRSSVCRSKGGRPQVVQVAQVVQVVRVAWVVSVVLVIKFVNTYGLHRLNNQIIEKTFDVTPVTH